VKLVDGSQDVETVFRQTAAALEPTMHKEVLACTQALLEVSSIAILVSRTVKLLLTCFENIRNSC
jgi:hypothetical protein